MRSTEAVSGQIATPAHFGLSVGRGVVEHLFGESDLYLIRWRWFGSDSNVRFEAASRPFPARPLGTSRELVPLRGVMTVIDKCGQATKGAWWMSWHREATKDVVACDMLREDGKRALIRRFPNEETRVG